MNDYKLMPEEATPEMLAAGEYALEAGCYVSGIYADMRAAAPDVQGEPVGEAGSLLGASGFTTAVFESRKVPVGTKLYATPQPATEQQLDATQLVDALVACAKASSAAEVGLIVDAALSAYRKRGDDE